MLRINIIFCFNFEEIEFILLNPVGLLFLFLLLLLFVVNLLHTVYILIFLFLVLYLNEYI